MYITLEADYAIRIVHFLAREGKRIDAKTIANKTGVTFRFALKILSKLVNDEVVCSFKGTKGGYEIHKSLDEISLKDIIELIDGEIMLSRCLTGEYPCTNEQQETCKVQKELERISKITESELEKVKISKLI